MDSRIKKKKIYIYVQWKVNALGCNNRLVRLPLQETPKLFSKSCAHHITSINSIWFVFHFQYTILLEFNSRITTCTLLVTMCCNSLPKCAVASRNKRPLCTQAKANGKQLQKPHHTPVSEMPNFRPFVALEQSLSEW